MWLALVTMSSTQASSHFTLYVSNIHVPSLSEIIAMKGLNNVTVDSLVQDVTPKARGLSLRISDLKIEFAYMFACTCIGSFVSQVCSL